MGSGLRQPCCAVPAHSSTCITEDLGSDFLILNACLPTRLPTCLAVSEVCEEAHISVQAVPPPDQAAAASALPEGKDGSPPNPFYYALLLGEAPLPTWLAPGSMASWSWQ